MLTGDTQYTSEYSSTPEPYPLLYPLITVPVVDELRLLACFLDLGMAFFLATKLLPDEEVGRRLGLGVWLVLVLNGDERSSKLR